MCGKCNINNIQLIDYLTHARVRAYSDRYLINETCENVTL